MKTYLLICFFLLFNSINSYATKLSKKDQCDFIRKKKCNPQCNQWIKFGVSLYNRCMFQCRKNYIICMKKANSK